MIMEKMFKSICKIDASGAFYKSSPPFILLCALLPVQKQLFESQFRIWNVLN
jgi:hypothetical protein